jgi:hypothetical protein
VKRGGSNKKKKITNTKKDTPFSKIKMIYTYNNIVNKNSISNIFVNIE